MIFVCILGVVLAAVGEANKPDYFTKVCYVVYYPNYNDTIIETYRDSYEGSFSPKVFAKWGNNKLEVGRQTVLSTTCPIKVLSWKTFKNE